jgi:DNA processing protein
MAACGPCERRSWLLERLSGHIEPVRGRLDALLALPDGELIAAVGGRGRAAITADYEAHGIAGLAGPAICRCDPAYPQGLHELSAPPPVLYVLGGRGGPTASEALGSAGAAAVAIVGTRRPTPHGLALAAALGRGLRACGLPVVSGLAAGIDAAAHRGALEAPAGPGPPTVAVVPGPADRAYPPAHAQLHRAILAAGGLVLSEVPPGGAVRRWRFLARNRTVAALVAATVVVEAGERSGALVTARHARELGRILGAVPGRVTDRQAAGVNALLRDGAAVIRGPQDVLDELFGSGARQTALELRPPPGEAAQRTLEAIAAGADTPEALARAGYELGPLAELELEGWVRRGPGGRIALIP